MQTTYHFKSTSEITIDVIEAIKTAFKGKSIKLTVEEEQIDTIPEWQKEMVLDRLKEIKDHPEKKLSDEDFQLKLQQIRK